MLLKLDNVGFQASNNGRHVLFELFDIRNSDGYIKQYALRLTGIATQQQWETVSLKLLHVALIFIQRNIHLGQLGFQHSNGGRQVLAKLLSVN